ncbi:hypothetical protein OPT61_g2504 [Boeremia exigua]|uniref:Uncharacterized protein n=1 Tax=Boeremia exigua TaxID=749465 RepID=A0ACC2ILG4_9PLEO|nr:hypothetical protein OPT61_g2504 [Boeremia exigua]
MADEKYGAEQREYAASPREKMSVGRYAATRITTLKPAMEKVSNPIALLRLLNLQQWMFFLVAFFAWSWDAFDFFTVSLTVEDLAETFHKTKKDITWGITLVLMLRSVGSIIFGLAADRYGRKWPFIINNVLFIILELGTGFCTTYEQFLGVRALFGIAMGGLYGNAAATDCPEAARGIISGMLQQGYAFGYLLATVFARAFVNTVGHGWRPLFWFGDLNFRIEGMPGNDVRRLLNVHTKNMDDEERPSTSGDPSSNGEDSVPIPPELDPASLQTTISCLLPHDELHQQMKSGKAFHDGWEEGPIRFLPTYKYDVGKVGVFDSSEKARCPSWCDRIIYRTRAGKQRYEQKVRDDAETRRRDEEMKKLGMDMPGTSDVLFDYDPETDGDNGDYDEYEDNTVDPEPEQITTKDGFSEELLLESYTSHMRVLSSDHKPLDGVFSLNFDAVVPDLKAAVHSEVARELDRQENEGRPSIAVVVERATGSPSPSKESTATDSSFDGVDFGDVKFAKSKRRNITIANTGRVPATFGFADRPIEEDQDAGPFPSWLTVTFDKEPDARSKSGPDDIQQRYTLAPAEVINAELKLKLKDVGSVRNLNDETQSLDEVLVLRVENGRDHFLPLRGQWQSSALARTVDKLIKIPEGGIRKLQHQSPSASETVKWSVPREVFRLTEAIEDLTERALAEWDMTKASDDARAPWMDNAGWPFTRTHTQTPDAWDSSHEDELADLYNALDTDTPTPTATDTDNTRTFTDVVQSLKRVYPQPKLAELSTSYLFICTLHLANEQGLVVENVPGYEDLRIRRDWSADLSIGS